MPSCTVCGKRLSIFELFRAAGIQRCGACEQRCGQLARYWSAKLDSAFAKHGISEAMERELYRQFQQARVPLELGKPIVQKMLYLREISRIRWGDITPMRVDIHLDTDEIAYFSMPATYYKPNKRLKEVPGRLVGTNKKCYFLSSTGKDSTTIDWNNVSKIDEKVLYIDPEATLTRRGGRPVRYSAVSLEVIHVTVSKGSGGGSYHVPDTLYTKTFMDTLVHFWKRQLVYNKEIATHGAVPEHVKAAVFRRDKGRCIQCGYKGPYIEYDHKIPRSKGGPNTVENIQLLCRMCNLQKGDRL
ncbi:HNH endonuclease [Ktedonosporobacter rubrisoli]|uniref:HNH endonuclease n=1 Tax=Ktedonosporobacter rubrisoli TaxID=2509675 RepID=A0A4P6JWW0_KTERU|nr:HNH endonuclease signature motif containing protein [Ktedonosporobacter rubrisoli]QBD79892.1 HNH endonuclease [Ktedonosporobacter rubrisoli]